MNDPHARALLLTLAVPPAALAHVGIRPRESKAGAEERYSVRVSTEGNVATTSVRLETLLLIKTAEGWKIQHSHTSGRPRRPVP